jgi:hypothetical protein
MRALTLALLALSACDGADALGQLNATREGEVAGEVTAVSARSCVLSIAASQHRPRGLYLFAELPAGNTTATLEFDVEESGSFDPTRAIYREDVGPTLVFRSQAVAGEIVLSGPVGERSGHFDLTFTSGDAHRRIQGSFAPVSTKAPARTGDNSNDSGGSSGTPLDTGCDGSPPADDEDQPSGCDSGPNQPDSDSGGGCSGDSGGGGSEGCSGDSAGGGCEGAAHAAHGAHRRAHLRPLPVRIASWLLPYALVGLFIRLWRRRALERARV